MKMMIVKVFWEFRTCISACVDVQARCLSLNRADHDTCNYDFKGFPIKLSAKWGTTVAVDTRNYGTLMAI